MRTFLHLSLLLLPLGVPWAEEAGAQERREPGIEVIEHTLANGLRFLIVPRPTSPTVAFVSEVRVGGMDEPPGETGIAHFLEHMLFKGTRTVGTRDPDGEALLLRQLDALHEELVRELDRTGEAAPDSARIRELRGRIRGLEDSARAGSVVGEFDRILSRNGAQGLNASTTADATTYHVELPAHRAKLWFALESDRLRDPVLREFHTERGVILEERRMRVESSPAGRLYEAHLAAAFTRHPYGRPVIGHPEDLERLGRDQLEAFLRLHYTPSNMVVAVVGAIEPDSVRRWAELWFGPIPRGPRPPQGTLVEPEPTSPRRIRVEAEAEPALRMGWLTVAGSHPDLPALSVANALLGGGRTGRLYRRLVLGDRIASSATLSLGPGFRDPTLLSIDATPRSPHRPEEVEAAILDELRRLAEEGPEPGELERIRTQLEAGEVRRLQSGLGLAFQLASSASTYGDWRQGFRFSRRMQEVTGPEVQEVVRRYLTPERAVVAVLARPADPEGGVAGDTLPPPPPAPLAVEADGPEALTFRPPEPESRAVEGVEVVHLRDPALPLVDLFIRLDGGYSHFSRELYAPFLALPSLLRGGGTEAREPDALDVRMEELALQTSFGGGGGSQSSSLNTLRSTLDDALALWTDILLTPRFDSARVEVWRGQELEGVRRRSEDPGRLAFSEYNRLLFGDHPVGWELEEADLAPDRFSPGTLRAVHASVYCRDNLRLGVAGDVTWEEIEPRIAAFVRRWPPCSAALPAAPEPDIRDEPGIWLLPRPIPQSTVVLAHPVPLRQSDSPDFFDSRIANMILGGGGFSSRLMTRVRVEEGYAYSVSSLWTTPDSYDGLVGATLQTGSATTGAGIRSVLEVMEEMRGTPPRDEEVEEAVRSLVNGYAFNFQTAAQVVLRTMAFRAAGLPEDWLTLYLERIQQVTPESVRAVMERYVDPARMMILVVGDPAAVDLPEGEFGPLRPIEPVSPPPVPRGSPQSPR